MFTVSAESTLQSLAYHNYFAPSVQKYCRYLLIKADMAVIYFCPLNLILM